MKQKTKQMILGTAMVMAIFLLSGCGNREPIGGNIMERAIESQTGGKVNINTEKGIMSVDSKDGSFSAGKNVKIPDDFPRDIFVYSDAEVTFSMSGISGGKSYSVSYFTKATPEEAFSKYKEEMINNGWQKESEVDMGAQGKIINLKKGSTGAMVTIGTSEDEENKGKTQIGLITTEDTSVNNTSSSVSQDEGAQE